MDGTIDVVKIYGDGGSFAALREDGSVVTWGQLSLGFNSAVASKLDGTIKVINIFSYGSAALREDGSVITWGGDNNSAVASKLTSGVVAFANPATDDFFTIQGATPYAAANIPTIQAGTLTITADNAGTALTTATGTVSTGSSGAVSVTVTTPNAPAYSSTGNFIKASVVVADLPIVLASATTAFSDTNAKYYVGSDGSNSYVITAGDTASHYTDVIQLTGVSLSNVSATDFVA